MSKVGEVLRFKDRGLSVDEARKAMIQAGEAPSGNTKMTVDIAAAAATRVAATPVVPAVPVVNDSLEPDFEEEVPEVPAAPVAPAVPVVTVVPERVETNQFMGEIKQENGKWVAELRYKHGAGTERFVATSRTELMLKLLEGKGNATMRVHKAVRREKFGFSELDRQYSLPEGVTAQEFEKMSEGAQHALLLSIASQNTIAFMDAHPEYHKMQSNSDKISAFLGKEKLPITFRNLEYALDELTDPNLPLEVRLEERPLSQVSVPVTPVPTSSVSMTAPVQVDSAPAALAVPAAPAVPAIPAAPAVVVRKRGTTGLQPGQSSLSDELGSPEAGGGQRQLSEAELRKLPLPELKRIANQDRIRRSGAQR